MSARTGGRAGAALLAILSIAAVACGATRFSAESLVAALNEHGAQLALGEPLGDSEDGTEIHSLSFTSAAPADAADVHAGGSLLIASGDDEALDQFHRCEASASLICFRAANAVLLFDGAVSREDLARAERAVRGLGDE